MEHVRIAELAGGQFNRVGRDQLVQMGMTPKAIDHRIRSGVLAVVEPAVYAIAPILDHDDWGRWMGATLTAPNTVLSRRSAAAAYGWWTLERRHETVTRPGSGGPRRHGGILVHHSPTILDDVTTLRGIPITTPERTLLDFALFVSDRGLARSLREAVRLEDTTLRAVVAYLGARRGRQGTARLAAAVARYAGVPIERARSGAEVLAMQQLQAAGRELPSLNIDIAGEEADLSWPRHKLIIEIDGGPFHLDAGEDARKEGIWRAAGWEVRRIAADAIYAGPETLLTRAP